LAMAWADGGASHSVDTASQFRRARFTQRQKEKARRSPATPLFPSL